MPKIFLIQGKEILILFRDYSILVSEAKYKAKHGKGLKILSPKQMPLRVPIALAQVKVVMNFIKL